MESVERILTKLDTMDEKLSKIREEASADRQKLDSHLVECASRNSAIHSRIDDMKRTQRFWSGKLIGAALGGGGFATLLEWMRGKA